MIVIIVAATALTLSVAAIVSKYCTLFGHNVVSAHLIPIIDKLLSGQKHRSPRVPCKAIIA